MTVLLTKRDPGTCGHCNRPDVGSPQAGQQRLHGIPVCSPPGSGRPDCFLLVTKFQHPLDCRCEERYPIAGDRERTIWT